MAYYADSERMIDHTHITADQKIKTNEIENVIEQEMETLFLAHILHLKVQWRSTPFLDNRSKSILEEKIFSQKMSRNHVNFYCK